MAACECCWEAAQWRAFIRGGVAAHHYQKVLVEHAEKGCDCLVPGQHSRDAGGES